MPPATDEPVIEPGLDDPFPNYNHEPVFAENWPPEGRKLRTGGSHFPHLEMMGDGLSNPALHLSVMGIVAAYPNPRPNASEGAKANF